jgi:hypothetical protein
MEEDVAGTLMLVLSRLEQYSTPRQYHTILTSASISRLTLTAAKNGLRMTRWIAQDGPIVRADP